MEKMVMYIDIESLLDLRQGFLVTKGKQWEEVFEYLNSIDYNNRVSDNLMEFSNKEYRQEVANGNVDLIKNSILTHVFTTLLGKLMNVSVKSNIDNVKYIPEVWVNVYPFELTEEEIDGIKNGLFHHINMDCYIEVISRDIKELTPHFIKEANIDTCFIYDVSTWINTHGNKLTRSPCIETEIVMPPIYEVEPTEEELEKLKQIGFEDGFDFLQTMASFYTKLTFLPITFYTNHLIANEIILGFKEEFEKETQEKSKEYEDEVEEYLHEHFAKQY